MAGRRRKKKRTRWGQFFYSLRYRVGEFTLRGFVTVLPWVPERWLTGFTHVCAWIAFRLCWTYRRRMEANVELALGDEIKEPAARHAMVWRAWRNFAQGILDTGAVMHWAKEKIIARIGIEGEEHLARALAAERGVIALSAHLGNFPLIGARLAAAGYPFSVVVKHPGDERFARLIDRYRAQVGIHTIPAKPRRQAVRGILRALRENRIVLVIADEFKSGGVMVNFMGRSSPAPRGPATLALRTGAATLPMFAARQNDGSVKLSIGGPIEPIRKQDLEESVAATTAHFTRYLETAIRRYPDQWNWLGFPRVIPLRGTAELQPKTVSFTGDPTRLRLPRRKKPARSSASPRDKIVG
jgi:KDO2-lipid IV(A) lauroyltransferase